MNEGPSESRGSGLMPFLKMSLEPCRFVVSCYLWREDRAAGEEAKLDDGDKLSSPDMIAHIPDTRN